MKKFFLFIFFFFFAPPLILASILYFFFLTYNHKANNRVSYIHSNKGVVFAALPSAENALDEYIVSKDARVEIVRQFFQTYKSPLEPFAQDVINAADKYELDFRLLPAIAMQESNLCHKIISDSYNCWGFGIYGKKVTRFTSYLEAINTVSKTLLYNYKNIGLDTPDKIMTKYTPSSNGSWAYGVNHFMDQLQ